MKRMMLHTVLIAVMMLAVSGVTTYGQDVKDLKFPKLNPIEIPKVEKLTLDNGMRLYLLVDKSLPVFNVSARINCGTYLDPPDKVGLGDLCGTVMRTGGTEKWTGDEIDEGLAAIGGSVETNVGLTSGSARVNVLSGYIDYGLDVLAEVLRRPVFAQEKIDLAKMQGRTFISRRNDDIGTIARREYQKLIYGAESPYARQTEYATLDAITRDDLVQFHATWFHPENVQMAIWGDFDRDSILAKIKSHFGDWEHGTQEVPPLPKVDYNWRSKVYYINKPDADQSYVRMGHIGGEMTDPDYTDIIVMNSILGGGFGSRLTDEVRTKLGLAYSVGGRYICNFGYPGYFFAVASTKPGSTIQAARAMIKEIKSMQTEPPTKEEMEKGKDGYLNSFVFNFDRRSEVINRMMTYDFYGIPENFLEEEKEGVEKVTPEAVVKAANADLRPDEMIVLVVGNAEKFDEPLESLGLGTPDTVDITIPSGAAATEVVITDETSKKGKDLLAQGVEAQGGKEAFGKITAVHDAGTYSIITPQGEMPISLEETVAFPGKLRQVANFMGRNQYVVINGKTGWKTGRDSLLAVTDVDVAKNAEDEARNTIVIFQHYNDSAMYQPVFDGTGTEGDSKVDYVALLDPDGENICRLAFDNTSHKLITKTWWGETIMGEGNVKEVYSDFKDVDGVLLPMKTETLKDGQKIGVMSYTTYEINPTISKETFARPE